MPGPSLVALRSYALLASTAAAGTSSELPLYPPLDLDAIERDVYSFVTATRFPDPEKNRPPQSLPPWQAHLAAIVTQAVGVLERAVTECGFEHLALSFNGGKDCTVLLHLLQAVRWRYWRTTMMHDGVVTCPPLPLLVTVHVAPVDGFPEEVAFVQKAAARYRLNLLNTAAPMRNGLTEFHAQYPAYTAVAVGTRRTDPYSEHLGDLAPCDAGWPPLLRVNPILDWQYADVWLFLLSSRIEYCPLYDLGYTSLGPKSQTVRNPNLKVIPTAQVDDGDVVAAAVYLPAWRLEDGSQERCGRLQMRK
ncbi:hypothetical protein BC828DRAFT_387324, partial [Blastocladiella britannica]